MRSTALLIVFLLASGVSADDKRFIRIVPSKTLPEFESISIYASSKFADGKEKPKPTTTEKFEKGFANLQVAVGEEAVHIFTKPKHGQEVLVAANKTVKPGEVAELKLADFLGVIEVFQKDGFPKVDRIVVTAPDDPGPDEKGHVSIQFATDYRVEMPVPEGFFAVWLVPANGARAIRIEERTRVLPGKIVRVGN